MSTSSLTPGVDSQFYLLHHNLKPRFSPLLHFMYRSSHPLTYRSFHILPTGHRRFKINHTHHYLNFPNSTHKRGRFGSTCLVRGSSHWEPDLVPRSERFSEDVLLSPLPIGSHMYSLAVLLTGVLVPTIPFLSSVVPLRPIISLPPLVSHLPIPNTPRFLTTPSVFLICTSSLCFLS